MATTDLYITYYKSPIGLLEIKADDEAVHAILFVNTWKGPNLDETLLKPNPKRNRHTEDCITQLTEYFEGKRTSLVLRRVSTPGHLRMSWTLRGIITAFVSSKLHLLYTEKFLIIAFISPPTAESCQHTFPGREIAENKSALLILLLVTLAKLAYPIDRRIVPLHDNTKYNALCPLYLGATCSPGWCSADGNESFGQDSKNSIRQYLFQQF